jgi:hypothetical protein
LIEKKWPSAVEQCRASLKGEKYGADDLYDAFVTLENNESGYPGTDLALRSHP